LACSAITSDKNTAVDFSDLCSERGEKKGKKKKKKILKEYCFIK
jgi:hypothetical protein